MGNVIQLAVAAGVALALYPLAITLLRTVRAWRRSRRLLAWLPAATPPPLVLPPPAPDPAGPDWPARYVRRGTCRCRAAAKLLVDGDQAYPEMLAALEAARATVDLETYLLRADRTGAQFQAALCRAARRGVAVRLLYDYVGSLGLPEAFVAELAAAGVAVSVFHPPVIGRPLWLLNRRDHRKLLLVDGHTAFLGGLNLSDDNLAAAGGWHDTHVRLDGAAVTAEGRRLFNQAWRRATAYGQTRTRAARLRAGLRRRLQALQAARDRGPATAPAVAAPAGVPVEVIGNGLFRHRWRIRRAYLYAIRNARHYILIENAYFIPDRAIRRALGQAAARGVLVAVTVARHSDVPAAGYAGRSLYSELLARGVRLFEWPHGMLHAKTAAIDDAWALVGSYNLDHRSLVHQLEVVAVIADRAFAGRLRAQLLADLARCAELTRRAHESRPWHRMLLESAAHLVRFWL